MIAGGNALWESLLTETKHELATLAATWQSRRARRIEHDPTMETGSDVTKPEPAPVHVGFTLEHARAHFNAAMAEEQPAPAPMSVFHQAQEE